MDEGPSENHIHRATGEACSLDKVDGKTIFLSCRPTSLSPHLGAGADRRLAA
jgi:hypothetical protein